MSDRRKKGNALRPHEHGTPFAPHTVDPVADGGLVASAPEHAAEAQGPTP